MPLVWESPNPYTLTSPRGTLPFNDALGTDGRFIYLDPAKCRARPNLRVEVDEVPADHGSILHAQFKSGIQISLGVEFWQDEFTAMCAADLTEVWDELHLHLDALVNPTREELEAGLCRLAFDLPEQDTRIWDRLKMLEWTEPELDNGVWGATFSLHTQYPYAMSLAQATTDIDSGTIVNLGNTPYYPVIRVHGPATAFTISNITTNLLLDWDSSRPGAAALAGGDYIEFVHFDNTAFVNGDESSAMAGLIVEDSQFFPLVPGENILFSVGDYSSIEMLWNHAWVS